MFKAIDVSAQILQGLGLDPRQLDIQDMGGAFARSNLFSITKSISHSIS